MITRRTLLKLAGGLGVLKATTACNSLPLGTSMPVSAEPITLSITFNGDVSQGFYAPRLKQYSESYPNIAFKRQVIQRDYTKTLESTGAAIGYPDIITADTYTFSALARQKAFLNLNIYTRLRNDFRRDDFFPEALRAFTYNDELVGLPDGINPMVLFYNRTMFEKAKINPPDEGWDWTELLRVAQQMHKPAEQVQVSGISIDRNSGYLTFPLQHDGQLVDNPNRPTRVRFDEPAFIEGIQFYTDLHTQHSLLPPLNVTNQTMRLAQMFAGQQIALYYEYMAMRGGLAVNRPWSFEWGVSQLPRDKQRVTLCNITGYGIGHTSRYGASAYSVLEWLTKVVPPANTFTLVPARRELAASNNFENLLPDIGRNAYVRSAAYAVPSLSFPGADTTITPLNAEIQRILEGKSTVVNALRAAQSKGQENLEAYINRIKQEDGIGEAPPRS